MDNSHMFRSLEVPNAATATIIATTSAVGVDWVKIIGSVGTVVGTIYGVIVLVELLYNRWPKWKAAVQSFLNRKKKGYTVSVPEPVERKAPGTEIKPKNEPESGQGG